MTGKAYWAIFQYYDGKLNKMAFKITYQKCYLGERGDKIHALFS